MWDDVIEFVIECFPDELADFLMERCAGYIRRIENKPLRILLYVLAFVVCVLASLGIVLGALLLIKWLISL